MARWFLSQDAGFTFSQRLELEESSPPVNVQGFENVPNRSRGDELPLTKLPCAFKISLD